MWPRGRRRNEISASAFVRSACTEWGIRCVAMACGVSERTVCRWRDGIDNAPLVPLQAMIDRLIPLSRGSGPVYSPEMAIDGYTRMAGVGAYSIRAAKGKSCRHLVDNSADSDW